MSAPADLHIHFVHQDGFAAWKPLWDGYNAFHGHVGEMGLPDIVTQATWQRFFDETEPVHALAAERGGELLSIVHFPYHRSTTQIDMSCYLQDLFIVQVARGQDVGRVLIEAVYRRVQADGLPRVYWQTYETNATAMRLYDTPADKSGFVVYRKLFWAVPAPTTEFRHVEVLPIAIALGLVPLARCQDLCPLRDLADGSSMVGTISRKPQGNPVSVISKMRSIATPVFQTLTDVSQVK